MQNLLKSYWPWVLAFVCLILGNGMERAPKTIPTEEVQFQIEEKIDEAIGALRREARQIELDLAAGDKSLGNNHIFLYWSKDSLVAWNKPLTFIPPPGSPIDSIFWIQSQSLKGIAVNHRLTDTTRLTGIIPLQTTYKILGRTFTADYNAAIFGKLEPEVFPPDEPGRQSILWNEKSIFSINLQQPVIESAPGVISWIAMTIGFMLLWIFPSRSSVVHHSIKNVLVIVGARFYMIYGEFPGTSSYNPVFDPKYFASSSLNDSPGNFLLNTIALFLCATLLLRLLPKAVFLRNPKYTVSPLRLIFFQLLLFGALLLPVLYLETIYHHAELTPDVTQSFIFSPQRVALISAAVLSGWIAFSILRKIVPHLLNAIRLAPKRYFFSLLVTLASVLIYQLISSRDHYLSLVALVVINVLLTMRWWPLFGQWAWIKSRLTFDYLSVIGLALIFSVVISNLDTEKSRKQIYRLGMAMAQQQEEFTEYLLRQAIREIAQDAFVRILNDDPLADKNTMRERIERKFPPGYFTDESPQFYYFDQTGAAFPETKTSRQEVLADLKLVWESQEGSIYLDTAAATSMITRRYVAVTNIGDYNKTTIALEINDRFFEDSDLSILQAMTTDDLSSQSLDPDLQFSAATYQDGVLLNSIGNFNYQDSSWKSYYSGFSKGEDPDFIFRDYLHLTLEQSGSRRLVLSTPSFDNLRWTTNFFFALFIALTLIALTWLARLILSAVQGTPVTYSDRIRLYLFGVFSIPVILIAFFVIRSVDQDAQENLIRNNRMQSERVAVDLGTWLDSGAEEEVIRSQLSGAGRSLGLNFIFYSPIGQRLSSGNPKLLESSLMPILMDPIVLRAFAEGGRFFSFPDKAGNLTYLSSWVSVTNPKTGALLGYLSAPDFRFYQKSEEQRIRIISVIVYVIVPVFLLFLVLSYAMVYQLTRPLLSVSRALQKTTLDQVSPAGQDEMGLIVSEYNRMVENLERSRKELVRQQRELAWREMARQVAHEIRNPLTPIKLTIQRLLSNFRSGRVEPADAEKSLQSVLVQTEVLNEIADSFSSLAGLPALQNARIDLTTAIKEDTSLFYSPDSGQILIQSPKDPVWIWFDRKFLSRVVSNLVLNARQSADGPVDIRIVITQLEAVVQVAFSDNGSGIDEENAAKIFSPYFTTKSSGTGLGLWLIKQGLEQSGGRIWFESEVDRGTTFFVELPLGDR